MNFVSLTGGRGVWGASWLRESVLVPPPGSTLVLLHGDSMFCFRVENVDGSETLVGAINVALPTTTVSVSVANNFIHSPTAADHRYHAFGELARFIYCLLQKIKKASALPLVEQWEEYVVPNHSRFPAIDERNFLVGTRVMAALGKVGSQYLQKEFRRDARLFLEDFVNCVLSTVAARSVFGQGFSCSCPAIVVSGDDVAPLQIFNKLLDGLLEKGWTRGARLRRAGMSTSPLCSNSGSWSGRPRGAALT